MTSLYHLTQDYLTLEQEILALDDLPEEEQEAAAADLANRFGELSGGIVDKLDNCAAMIQQWEAQEDAAKREAKRLTERAKQFSKRSDFLKARMAEALRAADTRKVEGERFTVALRKGSERVVCNDSTADLPEALLRYKDPEPDKTAIKAHIKGGGELPGWAIERGPDTLGIK